MSADLAFAIPWRFPGAARALRSAAGLFVAAAMWAFPQATGLMAGEAPGGSSPPASQQMTAADLRAARELFDKLRQAFLKGDYKAARELFAARTAEEEERRAGIAQALRREFRAEKYTAFEIAEMVPEDRLSRTRWSLWVGVRYACRGQGQDAPRENRHNDAFVVERLADGAFALVDSPFFATLGQRQGVGLLADTLLAAILLLAGLVFWVWMGYEAFALRPRSPLWRAALLLIPLLGALAFFLMRYLPDRWQGRTTRPSPS